MDFFILFFSLVGFVCCASLGELDTHEEKSSSTSYVVLRDVPSDHVLSLSTLPNARRRNLSPISQASSTNTLNRGSHEDSVEDSLGEASWGLPSGSSKDSFTSTYSLTSGEGFAVEIQAGSRTFKMLLDTGSTDLWLPKTGFNCYDIGTNASVPQSTCNFAETYNPSESETYKPVSNENFNITYGGGGRLIGTVANETIILAGITVDSQTIGIIDDAAWEGDGISSGILGMAYPAVGSVYPGTDPSLDEYYHNIQYNPLFFNMFEQGSINSTFSITYNRGAQDGQSAGYLAFGGLPPVSTVGATAQVDIIDSPYDIYYNTYPNPYKGKQLYSVTFDGIIYQANNSSFSHSASPSCAPPTINSTTFLAYLDSGTSVLFLDPAVASSINALFSPPAVYNASSAFYDVPCTASPPALSFVLGGVVFPIDPRDLIHQINPGLDNDDGGSEGCFSMVMDGAYPSTIGVPFFVNTVVTHDVGAAVVRVVARERY